MTRDNRHPNASPANVQQIVQGTSVVADVLKSQWDAQRCRTLFNNMSVDTLRNLQTQEEDVVAIRAAWQAVTLAIPEERGANGEHISSRQLHWFVGFLEGRLHVPVPSWWSEAILDSRASRDFVRPGRFRRPMYHDAGLHRLSAPVDTVLRQESNAVVLTVGSESVSVSQEVFAKTEPSAERCNVTALITTSRSYIAVHGQVGYPYDLACIDRLSGKTLWRSRVRGTWSGFSNGYHEMRVTVMEHDKHVVVFGCALTGIYIEKFRSADGLAVFRFSSSY